MDQPQSVMEVRLEIANLDSGVKSPGRPNMPLPCPNWEKREAAVVLGFSAGVVKALGRYGGRRGLNPRLENRGHLEPKPVKKPEAKRKFR